MAVGSEGTNPGCYSTIPGVKTYLTGEATTSHATASRELQVSLGIAGITCYEFNAEVYDLALDSIVQNATFSDAVCADATSSSVVLSNEVTLPLVIAASYGISAHEVGEHALRVAAVCDAEERVNRNCRND